MTNAIKLAALAPVLLLGGCLSLGGEAPDSLLTLTPTSLAPAGSGASAASDTALAIVEFDVPKALDVTHDHIWAQDTSPRANRSSSPTQPRGLV